MEEIKWIFFDMGYTLIDEEAVWKTRCEQQAVLLTENGKKYSGRELFYELNKSTEIKRPKYKDVMKSLGFSEIIPYNPELEKPYKDTEKVLLQLSKKYKLGLIANQGIGLNDRLKSWGIDKYFGVVISSYDEGVEKPSLDIFRLATERAKVSPKNAVMVGDRADNDIYPAKKFGMKTILIRQGNAKNQELLEKEYVADEEVKSIIELLDIL